MGERGRRVKVAKTKNGKPWLKSIWFTILSLSVLVFISIPLSRNLSQEKIMAGEIKSAQEEIDKYEGQNKNLKELLGYLETDESITTRAKMNLGLKEPGEKVVIIQDATSSAVPARVNEGRSGNPVKWYNYFFK